MVAYNVENTEEIFKDIMKKIETEISEDQEYF